MKKHLGHAITSRADPVLRSNPKMPNYAAIARGPRGNGTNQHSKSLETSKFDTSKKDKTKYTGDELLGVATMHKSNSVPVSRNSDMAEATAKMRRN